MARTPFALEQALGFRGEVPSDGRADASLAVGHVQAT